VLHLPTDNVFIYDEERYIQPTCIGKKNGGFGLVRENGMRFHGGIDIKPILRDADNEPLDVVRAVADGVVRYVNRFPEKSSLGMYVVVEHEDFSASIHSLYAHLGEIDKLVEAGKRISQGTQIGVIGRTCATYAIQKQFAHLHFELGLRLGSKENFSKWYNGRYAGDENLHCMWNYLNFISFDPLPPLKIGSFPTLKYLKNLPTAFVTRVYCREFPDFLQRYPDLLDQHQNEKIIGFDIEWTWFCMPKRWKVLTDSTITTCNYAQLLFWDKKLLSQCIRRKSLAHDSSHRVIIGPYAIDVLEKIFGSAINCK
jgi:hypothetical protein